MAKLKRRTSIIWLRYQEKNEQEKEEKKEMDFLKSILY